MKRKENDLNQPSMIMFQPLIFRGVSAKTHLILELEILEQNLAKLFSRGKFIDPNGGLRNFIYRGFLDLMSTVLKPTNNTLTFWWLVLGDES